MVLLEGVDTVVAICWVLLQAHEIMTFTVMQSLSIIDLIYFFCEVTKGLNLSLMFFSVHYKLPTPACRVQQLCASFSVKNKAQHSAQNSKRCPNFSIDRTCARSVESLIGALTISGCVHGYRNTIHGFSDTDLEVLYVGLL